MVDRLIPQVDVDLDALDDEEIMSASKERRNLIDVFMEKRRGVSGLKLRTLLKVSAHTIVILKKCAIVDPTVLRVCIHLYQTVVYAIFVSNDVHYTLFARGCIGLTLFPLPHQENKLSTFDKDMKAFTRALDQALLPKPKLLEVGTSIDHVLRRQRHIESIVAIFY